MNYHEVERFQRKVGQTGFSFRDTGAHAFEARKTGWSLVDQVAAAAAPSTSPVTPAPREAAFVDSSPARSVPAQDSAQAQDAALERFASLLQARHRREAEEVRPALRDKEPLKQLLRRIAVVTGQADESQAAQC